MNNQLYIQVKAQETSVQVASTGLNRETKVKVVESLKEHNSRNPAPKIKNLISKCSA